jgi:hypothetical protein
MLSKKSFSGEARKMSPLTARGGKFSVAFRMIVPQAEKSGTSRFRLFRQYRPNSVIPAASKAIELPNTIGRAVRCHPTPKTLDY